MSIQKEQGSIELTPKPGFVVKTRILASKNHPLTTKVFINICHDEQVPQPTQEFDVQATFSLIIDNEWEIPLILSKEKTTTDKKGVPSIVYDCIINSKCFTWITINSDLRSIMIEWSIEAIELLYEVTLEREYTIPKMQSKGEISTTIIPRADLTETGLHKKLQQLKNNEVLGLIEEIQNDGHQEEQEQLPNLLRINQGQNKVLIEEIDDGNDRVGSIKVPHTTNQSTINSSDTKHTKHTSTSRRIDYNLTFHKLHQKYQLLIKFTSTNTRLNGRLVVEYNSKTSSITISSDEYSFGTQNTLDIPLSTDIDTDISQCFLVKPENCLYIFV